MTGVTLALDGSVPAPSAALLRDGSVIAVWAAEPKVDDASTGRGEALVPAIDEMLRASALTAREIARVVCGAGPGSFTSLRIAASVAKGIAVAADAPMYAVSSLVLTVAGVPDLPPHGTYLSVLPAMRGEWFALSVIVSADGFSGHGELSMVREDDLEIRAGRAGARIIGPGRAISALPHARGVARVLGSVLAAGPIDVAIWEPDYGRLAEAQVKWEATHGRPLGA